MYMQEWTKEDILNVVFTCRQVNTIPERTLSHYNISYHSSKQYGQQWRVVTVLSVFAIGIIDSSLASRSE